MIHFSLACDNGHGFDGWFASGADFDAQSERGLVSCPVCQSARVRKRLMAPAVAGTREREERHALAVDAQQREALGKIRALVAAIRENSDDVGERFVEEARRIHYGEAEARGLIGKATIDEARELSAEGISVAPLPFLPDDVN
ncbi:DUF1178 family protein [Ensifer soli]|uniref:DUF1178 family protein n=1 Tax=Ciceribacter sp. sgz301302 TaxID=3342379 RepID=UPI0035BA65B7